jgi:hypothetical protein
MALGIKCTVTVIQGAGSNNGSLLAGIAIGATAVCVAAEPCGAAEGIGLATAAILGAATLGLSGDTAQTQTGATSTTNNDPRVTVYRVVDPTELAYLQANGNYGSNPSESGKYFALTPGGAQAFAGAPINAGSTITSTTLPQSVVNQGFPFPDPGQNGAGPSVFFGQPQLPTVYGTMTPPVILPGGQ